MVLEFIQSPVASNIVDSLSVKIILAVVLLVTIFTDRLAFDGNSLLLVSKLKLEAAKAPTAAPPVLLDACDYQYEYNNHLV